MHFATPSFLIRPLVPTSICITILGSIAAGASLGQQPPAENPKSKTKLVDRSQELNWGGKSQKQVVNKQELPTQNNPARIDNQVVPASFLLQEEQNRSAAQENNSAAQENNSASAVSDALKRLPNSAGQVWREYDISGYTSRITTTQNPQKALVDWILRETGSDIWFGEPLGILSASRTKLRVYHTPEVQSVVQRIVDQLVRTQGQVQIVGLKVVTVANPNWRTKAMKMLQPIRVQSPGVEGWIVSKENAAVLFGQLRSRGDFRTIKNGDVSIHDGQKLTVSQLKPVDYFQSVQLVTNRYGVSQWQPVKNRIQEGFSLEIGALTSSRQKTIETVLNCQVDQVEKLQSVRVDVPVQGSSPQSVQVQVPQMISWRLKERFRWSSDQVLVLSCGVVATPNPDGNGGLGLGNLLNQSRGRADAILFIEYKGPAQQARVPTAQSGVRSADGLHPVGPRR